MSVKSNEPLIIEGHDLVIPDIDITRYNLPTTRNQEMVTIRADYVTLVSPWIDGSKPRGQGFSNKYEGEHGIGLHGCKSVKILDPMISNVHGDFIYCGPRGVKICEDINIHNPQFLQSGRQGISALAVKNLTVTGMGRIWGFRNSGIDTERQFGQRSTHEGLHVARDTISIKSWRKMKKEGLA